IASGGTAGCAGHKHRCRASLSRLLALSGVQGLALGSGRAHPGLSTACCARRRPMGAGRAYKLGRFGCC
ncbi:hypothetical protein A2U01_0040724, partial [Trifolium medium]|nr:hypothetical protein [Trifolium medium]